MKPLLQKLLVAIGVSKAMNDKKQNKHGNVTADNIALPSIPASTFICRKPDDLPKGVIVSGTEKNAQIQLKGEDAQNVVVIKNLKTYTILVSSKIYGTPYATKVFGIIRESLHSLQSGYDEKIAWATPEIVLTLRDRKSVAADDSNTLSTSENPYAQLFTEWLKEGMRVRASDMHIESSNDVALIRFRIDGELYPFENGQSGQVMADVAKNALAAVYNKLSDKGSNTNSSFNENNYFSNTLTYEVGDIKLHLRCQFAPTADGFDFISRFRVAGKSKRSIEEMGFVQSQIDLVSKALIGRRGLIIVAGIPNSGKTTLVEAILTNFPMKHLLKLVTLDDPVEFKVPGVSHAQIKTNTADVDESARSYMQAIQSWLRGNPDVLSLGEIRNSASGASAITTARVGCLGIATIHANSQMGIYERLTDEEIGLKIRALTSDGIVALCVYQTLVPLLCAECSLPISDAPLPIQARVNSIAQKFSVDTSKMRISHGKVNGITCPCCNGKGTKGMKAVAEMYSPNEQFLKLLRIGDDFGARDLWLSESDGKFDSDNMNGKPVFLHAFKDALDGVIDFRVCDRIGSFEDFDVRKAQTEAQRKTNRIPLKMAQKA